MSDQEWADYVEAFKLLATTPDPSGSGRSIYSEFAYIHDIYSDDIHGNNLFLAWHREHLWKWDVALNSVKPGVVQPYFDWSVSAADIFSDPVFNEDRLGGSVGTSGNQESPIPDGSFEGLESDHRSPHMVTRNFVNDALATTELINAAVAGNDAFESFRLVLEFDIHNAFHRTIGGDMVTRYSPNAPFFYFHHAFIDMIYRRWENRNVGTNSESELGQQMAPWSETTRDVLDGPATTCVSYEGLDSTTVRFPAVSRQSAVEKDAKFETASEKVEALEVVSKKKVDNPSAYKKQVKQYTEIRKAAAAAAVLLKRDLGELSAAQKITATVLLKEGIIDISEAEEVLKETDEEVRQEGEENLNVLQTGVLPDDVSTEDVIDKNA